MARHLIKTTREDATGFHKPKKAARESILKPLDESAVNAFAQKRQQVAEPSQPAADMQAEDAVSAETTPAPAPNDERSPVVPEDTALTSNPAVDLADEKEAAPDAAVELVDLVVPPRKRNARTLSITLRLRVLERHVEPLTKLQSSGVDVQSIMRSAFNRLPKMTFEPRYVAQVAEPSGAGGWGLRTTIAIKPETLQAIQAQVRGGAKAPRSRLLLGQVEPAWFSSLDQTIKDFMK